MSDTILFAGARSRILVTGEQTDQCWALLSNEKPAGSATPVHLHRQDTELLYVLSGELTVEAGGSTRILALGEVAVLPENQPHRLSNRSAGEARYLLLSAPAGFERFTLEVGERAVRDDEPAKPLTDDVLQRILEVAPSYGIEILDDAALLGASAASETQAAEIVDVIGICIEVLAQAGPGESDPILLRAELPPSAMIPLHSHREPECFVVLEGRLEVHVDGVWHGCDPGAHVFIPSGARHAVRNSRSAPTIAICATSASLASFFRAAGGPPGAHPPGPPSREQMERLVEAALAHGHTLYGPEEQAAAGLEVGPAS
ncbi:protein of unknown function [Beijerinckiaceae bacterium RH AL1]|nr:protein of unknown function [Beijerinckiaceae bacterium RH CH11]VVB46799.1 protein of unknown function [Beijerinckiaceae bacterium RH AL8]VVC55519.1 protein of unknown function [Beijerinckiaceae bacterium RH AL1]